MRTWFERWIAGTRGRVLGLLRVDPRTVSDLAERVGVSDNAVRTHLASLQRDGLVEDAGSVQDRSVGKPAQLFRITEQGEEAFPKAYAVVLSEILRVVAEREGEGGLVELLREVGRRASAAGTDEAASAGERVETTAALLGSLGADVEVEASGPNEWRIEGRGCPLSAVVREQAVACMLIESLIAEVTGAEVTQCCRHGDRPRCSFRVEAPRR